MVDLAPASMRLLLLGVAFGLAACSGLPPEPIVPLAAGEAALGLTLDVRLAGEAPAGLSIWGALGAGRGVDVAFNADVLFSVVGETGAIGRGERPFLPPGIAVRKSFANGVGVGLGIASVRTPLEAVSPHRGLVQMTAGPFVSVGSSDPEAALLGRASAHVVYQVRVAHRDSTADVRRGLAFYGVASGGPVVRSDSGFTVFGARTIVGTGSGAAGVTVGPFVERYDAGRASADR